MQRVRWEVLVSAALLAGAIILHGLLGRYQLERRAYGPDVVLDRLTGRVCRSGGCWRPGERRVIRVLEGTAPGPALVDTTRPSRRGDALDTFLDKLEAERRFDAAWDSAAPRR